MAQTNHNNIPASLLTEIRLLCESNVVGGDFTELIEHLISKYGKSVSAIILYGSCLRNQNFENGIIDLYVVISSYEAAYDKKSLRILNSLLAPNVFYTEVGENENKIRAKYAVISLEDLDNSVENWFHSYIWSRFAQPVRFLYTRDSETKINLYNIIAKSVIKFLNLTIAALGPGRFNTEAIWVNGLTLTYAAELRPEQTTRAQDIAHQSISDLVQLTLHAAPAIQGIIKELPGGYYQTNTTSTKMKKCMRIWRLRRWQGRILSILRLMKAVFTFKDCVDYAAWKIKRHTGINIEVTPILQKHPILFGLYTLWHLLRRNTLR
ncbi:MAG: putative nucleotidyltransferase [Gammaproteobacteria bacterium]